MEHRPPKSIDLRLASAVDADGTVSFANTLVRPVGLLQGRTAADAVDAGAASWMTGGMCAYTAIELIEGQGAFVERDIRTAAQAERALAPQARQRLEMLKESRASLAGLTWSRPRIMADMTIAGAPDAPGERSANAALQHATILAREGADFIALRLSSGLSDTAPDRLAAAVSALADAGLRPGAVVSSPELIRAAARSGVRVIIDDATIIDEEALYALGDCGLPIVLRHAGPTDAVAKISSDPGAIAREIHVHLEDRIAVCEGAGIPRRRLIVDPGLGFGKSRIEVLALARDLALFHGLGCPVMTDLTPIDVRPRRAPRTVAAGDEPSPRLDDHIHAVDLANAAVRQGVQMIALADPARAWRMVAAFCEEQESVRGETGSAEDPNGDTDGQTARPHDRPDPVQRSSLDVFAQKAGLDEGDGEPLDPVPDGPEPSSQ